MFPTRPIQTIFHTNLHLAVENAKWWIDWIPAQESHKCHILLTLWHVNNIWLIVFSWFWKKTHVIDPHNTFNKLTVVDNLCNKSSKQKIVQKKIVQEVMSYCPLKLIFYIFYTKRIKPCFIFLLYLFILMGFVYGSDVILDSCLWIWCDFGFFLWLRRKLLYMETSSTCIIKGWYLFFHSIRNSHWCNSDSAIWKLNFTLYLVKNHHFGCLIMAHTYFPTSLLCSISKDINFLILGIFLALPRWWLRK